jgi:hypothetical protein
MVFNQGQIPNLTQKQNGNKPNFFNSNGTLNKEALNQYLFNTNPQFGRGLTSPTGNVISDLTGGIGQLLENISKGEFWLNVGGLVAGIIIAVIAVNGLIRGESVRRENSRIVNVGRYARKRK